MTEPPVPETVRQIRAAVDAMGTGPLTGAGLARHAFGLFSRVRARDEIYLANHSLGRPLDAMGADVQEFCDLWYADMDAAWDAWIGERDAYRSRIARLIGCDRPDAVVPKTAAGQGLRAVINALPGPCPRVLATRGEFDSIDFILKAYAEKGRADVRWVDADDRGLFDADRIARSVAEGVDLVVLPLVFFVTGQLLEGAATVIDAARRRGALTLLDCYHAVGVMPLDFDGLGADFMIGGNYKYTRGGPGACWLAVHPRHLHAGGVPAPMEVWPIDTGWFAKREPFAYRRADRPEFAAGGDGWLESTPPAITYYQARSGLEFTLAVGVRRLHDYAGEQLATLEHALRAHGAPVRDVGRRGGYLLVPSEDHARDTAALRALGVNVDSRPDPHVGRGFLRVCPDVLTTDAEMERGAAIIGRVVAGGVSGGG